MTETRDFSVAPGLLLDMVSRLSTLNRRPARKARCEHETYQDSSAGSCRRPSGDWSAGATGCRSGHHQLLRRVEPSRPLVRVGPIRPLLAAEHLPSRMES